MNNHIEHHKYVPFDKMRPDDGRLICSDCGLCMYKQEIDRLKGLQTYGVMRKREREVAEKTCQEHCVEAVIMVLVV